MGAGRLAALAGLCVSLGAADPAPGLNGIRQANLRADIGFLASGPLEGRRSLRRGADVAAQFIAAEFAKAGLQPAAGGSFFQPVPLVEYRVDENRATLAVERGGRRLFRYGADFRGSFPQDAAVRAPVVFAGYGIAAPEFGYDDYAGLDVRGKAVLIFEREPRQYDPDSVFNGLGNTRHVNAEVKARAAQRNGAAAVLLAVEPNRKRASSPRAAAAPGGGPRVPPPPAQALAESEIRIPVVRIGDAVLEALFAGAGKSPAALQSEIDATMKQASMPLSGAHVDLRIALEERRRGESANVAGLIPGRDPALAHETILFTAHYDHDGDWDGRLRPGADDNASGTAGLIELARAYARNPEPPRRTLLFLALTAEERGLLGAWHYVANPLRPLSGARAVINFDMIGRDETPSRQTDGLIEISPDTSNEQIGRAHV